MSIPSRPTDGEETGPLVWQGRHCWRRGCRARIVVLRTTKRSWMPVDLEPAPDDGNLIVKSDGCVVVLTKTQVVEARARGRVLYRSHFASCPDRPEFKPREKR